MSENSERPVKTSRSHTKIVILILSLLVLLLVYGGGFLTLPVSILAKYRGKDCSSVLTMNRIYAGLYPQFSRDASLVKYVQECEAYTLAVSNEENEKWDEAYDAYQTYGRNYPGGLYADQVDEHSANALMKIVQDQVEQKNYEEALQNLDLIVTSYSDTSVSADALSLILSAYSSWGSDLRTAEDFEKSEQVFNDFKAWSQTNQKSDLQGTAQSQLAETYLEWGESLQAQKQFEEALAKFDQATSVSAGSPFDTSKIKADQVKLYIDWGNDLLEQGNFPVAIEKFQLAVTQSAGDASAGDALANGQIQWALDLKTKDDFRSALEHLRTANEAAMTDTMKQSVQSAFDEAYLALSNSSGPQAQRAMNDAMKNICDRHTKPEMPILGLNKETIRVGIYGFDPKPFGKLAAVTSSEAHYVACVKNEERIIARSGIFDFIRVSNSVFLTIPIQEWLRIQIVWTITIRRSDTGEVIATKVFEGGIPPGFPGKKVEVPDPNFTGKPPSINSVLQWIQSNMK